MNPRQLEVARTAPPEGNHGALPLPYCLAGSRHDKGLLSGITEWRVCVGNTILSNVRDRKLPSRWNRPVISCSGAYKPKFMESN